MTEPDKFLVMKKPSRSKNGVRGSLDTLNIQRGTNTSMYDFSNFRRSLDASQELQEPFSQLS